MPLHSLPHERIWASGFRVAGSALPEGIWFFDVDCGIAILPLIVENPLYGESVMQSEDIFALGLGLKSPWKLLGQRFDMDKQPHELHLLLGAKRGIL